MTVRYVLTSPATYRVRLCCVMIVMIIYNTAVMDSVCRGGDMRLV